MTLYVRMRGVPRDTKVVEERFEFGKNSGCFLSYVVDLWDQRQLLSKMTPRYLKEFIQAMRWFLTQSFSEISFD